LVRRRIRSQGKRGTFPEQHQAISDSRESRSRGVPRKHPIAGKTPSNPEAIRHNAGQEDVKGGRDAYSRTGAGRMIRLCGIGATRLSRVQADFECTHVHVENETSSSSGCTHQNKTCLSLPLTCPIPWTGKEPSRQKPGLAARRSARERTAARHAQTLRKGLAECSRSMPILAGVAAKTGSKFHEEHVPHLPDLLERLVSGPY
jgi:hypothetical protein